MGGMGGSGAWIVRDCMIVLGASVLTALSGCGGSGGAGADKNPRVDAYGTVTFKGEPIPFGSVVFTHLETGNQSNCPIDDGEYENESGDGPIVGKNSVSIIGLDGEHGKQLWSGTWSQEVTITEETFKQGFEVKEDQVKPPGEIDMSEEAPLY